MRVASLVPSATEMLFALRDAQPVDERLEVVAVTHECDYPPGASALPHLTSTVIPEGLSAAEIDAEVKRVTGEGRALYELDEQTLREVGPDLVVTQALCEVCAVSHDDVVAVAARLPGAPSVVSQDPGTLAAVLEDVERLGAAVGSEEPGVQLRARLQGRLDAVREAVAGRERPRVLALEWLDPAFVGGHWVPEMIELAGGTDVIGEAGARSREVEWAELTVLEPDVVVAMPCGYYVEESARQVGLHADRVGALGAREVHAVDAASSFSRPGPRLVDGVELLASILHPGAVDAPDGVASRRVPVA